MRNRDALHEIVLYKSVIDIDIPCCALCAVVHNPAFVLDSDQY